MTGAVFYVMGHVDGFMPTDPLPEAFTSVEGAPRAASAVTDAIAALSCVDWRAAGIADLGRPEGFHERQVRRWMTQYTSYPSRSSPASSASASGSTRGSRRCGSRGSCTATTTPGTCWWGRIARRESPPSSTGNGDIGDPMLDLAGFLRFWFETRPARGGRPRGDDRALRRPHGARDPRPRLLRRARALQSRGPDGGDPPALEDRPEPRGPTDLHVYSELLVLSALAIVDDAA